MTKRKTIAIKVIAMPADANPDGDVFGGWIVSQMDLAAALTARKIANNRVVTVAIENIDFQKPVFIGDCVECCTTVEKIGNTSIVVFVEVIVERRENRIKEKVTQGKFVFVSVDEHRKPKSIKNVI